MTAVYAGSFDPITIGHIDIIERASKLFDKVIILVATNTAKHYTFSKEERLKMIKKSTSKYENIIIDEDNGLLVDYVKRNNIDVIVRGLRTITDFEYEFQMALTNKKLNNEIETVFLTTSLDNMFLSSSMVKEIAKFNGDISSFVPKEILEDVSFRFKEKI